MKKQEQQPAPARATVRQIAIALGVSPQAAKKRAKKAQWHFEEQTWPGGQRRLYEIAQLPADVQIALAPALLQQSMRGGVSIPILPGEIEAGATSLTATPSRSNSDAELATLAAIYEAKPQREKDEASARMEIVCGFLHLRTSGVGRAAALGTISGARRVSIATIARYLSIVEGKPEHTWLYLLTPRYRGREAGAEMSAEAWEILKADYLRPERPSATACINRIRRVAVAKDWMVPSTRTLLRRLDGIERGVRVLAREGAKALQQLYPAQSRDKSALAALQIINGDGYKHNVWARFPDGEVLRAKTWFWQDVYSGKILAWRTDKTEHTDVIRLSFGDLVERFGIPDEAVIDNTMAAANKTMSGGIRHRFRFKVREDEPLGVFALLNVRVRWATPGHGQAKPVERVFGIGGIGEIVDKAPEFSGAWTGAHPLDKPEYDGKTRAVEFEQLETVIAREVASYNAIAGRRGAIAQGRSFDGIFQESYSALAVRRATEAQRRLWLLATEPVKAHAKDGAITLDAGRLQGRQANRYWAGPLVEYAGQSVVARFDPRQLHTGVHTYTVDGRYICYADCFAPAGFNDQNAGREHNRARRQYVRSQRDGLDATRRMDALEAAKSLSTPEPTTIPAPAISRSGIVRAEFRSALERPRADAPAPTSEELADVARLEAEFAAPAKPRVYELRDDHERHTYWLALRARVDAGEELAAEDRAFHQSWQQDPYFRFINEEGERKAG